MRPLLLVLGDSITMSGLQMSGQLKFSPFNSSKSTVLYELYPIISACLLRGSRWTRKQIIVFYDNAATVEIINKGCSKTPLINSLLCCFTWTCVLNNFILQATLISGHKNCVADAFIVMATKRKATYNNISQK